MGTFSGEGVTREADFLKEPTQEDIVFYASLARECVEAGDDWMLELRKLIGARAFDAIQGQVVPLVESARPIRPLGSNGNRRP